MTAWVGFLRAINLGRTRKFPKDEIAAATKSIGMAEVETYINTGNVRFSTTLRSRERIETALESAYAERIGFEVPTICFPLVEIVAIADEIAQLNHPGRHFVSLLKYAPDASLRAELIARAPDGERVVVNGRAVHLLLGENYHTAKITNDTVERRLGVATNRAATVITSIADRWTR